MAEQTSAEEVAEAFVRFAANAGMPDSFLHTDSNLATARRVLGDDRTEAIFHGREPAPSPPPPKTERSQVAAFSSSLPPAKPVNPGPGDVWWVGMDRWRGEHLAKVTAPDLRVIPAIYDGKDAWAVVNGDVQYVEWDSFREPGYRLEIK